jgi:hypothetical protein
VKGSVRNFLQQDDMVDPVKGLRNIQRPSKTAAFWVHDAVLDEDTSIQVLQPHVYQMRLLHVVEGMPFC